MITQKTNERVVAGISESDPVNEISICVTSTTQEENAGD